MFGTLCSSIWKRTVSSMRLGGWAMFRVCSAWVSQLMVSCRDVWKPVAKETASSSFAWKAQEFKVNNNNKYLSSDDDDLHVSTQSHPAVVHLGVEAGPFVLQHAQVLLGLGGAGSCFLSSTSQQHGLSLIQQAVVLVSALSELSLKLLQTEKTTNVNRRSDGGRRRVSLVGLEQSALLKFHCHHKPDVSV